MTELRGLLEAAGLDQDGKAEAVKKVRRRGVAECDAFGIQYAPPLLTDVPITHQLTEDSLLTSPPPAGCRSRRGVNVSGTA